MQIGPDDAFVNGYIDGSELVLLTREASGRLRDTRLPAEFVAYFKADALQQDLRRMVERIARTSTLEDNNWLRVGFRDADVRRAVCYQEQTRNRDTGDVFNNPLIAAGVRHYEADLDPIRRLLTDTGAKTQCPKRSYIDLETDSRLPFSRKHEMRILCWAMTDDLLRTSCSVLDEWNDNAERRLLEDFWDQLAAYDQVAAWNGGEPDPKGDGFDFPVLMARSEVVRVRNIEPRRFLYVDQMVTFKRMNAHVAESGEEKQSMKLQDIAMATVGRGKKDFDASKTYEAWEADGQRRRDLVSYCVEDTELLPAIEKKTGYLDLFATICEVCRLFASTESLNPTRQMDGFLLRLARERGYHLQSRTFNGPVDGDDQFRGAYVMPPKSVAGDDKKWSAQQAAEWRAKEGMTNGIVRNVHVADFASLYPSIILTWNMSGDTKAPVPINGPLPPNSCRCPTTGTGFRTDVKGLLPTAVAELIRLRKQYNDLKSSLPPGTTEWYDADRRSMAYKVTANSFYGVLGSAYSRYHDRSIAEGVTQNGVWLIQQTISAAESRGWRVVYGDTDSIFVVGCTKEEFSAFTDWCNKELYPQILKDKAGCAENHIKLAYEKEFDRLIFTGAKRYIGRFVHYKGKAATKDSKPEVKGLEYKRGDTSALARELQIKAVKLLMDGHEDLETFHKIVSEARQRVLEGDMPLAQVVQSKSLSKPLKEYVSKPKADGTTSAPPPHVVIARLLASRGQDVSAGTRIGYVVLDEQADEPSKKYIPAEDFTGDFDRHYVWESMVYPATQRLLVAAFPLSEAHWDAWAKSRPPRPRQSRTKVLFGQSALFAEEITESRLSVPRSMPAPALPSGITSER